MHNGHDNDRPDRRTANPSSLKGTITDLEPGVLGGVESQLASNGKTVFAAINNLAVK